MPKFNNPTYQYKLGRDEELWWVGYPVAKDVAKKNGVWKTYLSMTPEFVATCEVVLRGGFLNEISEELADELVAAGYGEFVEY